MRNLLIYTILATFLISCTNDDAPVDCSLILPPPNNILLNILNSEGESVIGNEFVQDSFRLRGNNQVTYLKPQVIGEADEQALSIFFTQMDDGVSYLLDLSETVTDTIRMDYTATANECYVSYSIEEFYYNNEVAEEIGFAGETVIVRRD